MLGTEAPAYIRIRLQGWGMSALECCVRSLQAYIKFENLVFELLDESKIDVYKILGFNTALLSGTGTEMARQRILEGNRMKNFQNAIVMDKEDEYEQKKLGEMFAGLASLWEQLRLNLCADTGMPMNVLFGMSSTGFSSGEDAIKNYNRLVEATRTDSEPVLCEAIDLRCQQMFGFIPEYEVEWTELQEISAPEAEQVKDSKQNRVLARFDRGLETAQESLEELDKEGVMDQETEVLRGDRDVDPQSMMDHELAQEELKQAKGAGRKDPGGRAPPAKAAPQPGGSKR
jgi:phage-related protein (TIGR01555 family)